MNKIWQAATLVTEYIRLIPKTLAYEGDPRSLIFTSLIIIVTMVSQGADIKKETIIKNINKAWDNPEYTEFVFEEDVLN